MNRVGMGTGYPVNNWNTGKTAGRKGNQSYVTTGLMGMGNEERIPHRAEYSADMLSELYEQGRVKSVNDIRRSVLPEVDHVKEEAGQDSKSEKESNVDTEVIVRPDGSRVLMMRVNIGGMSTTMSVKISEPTEAVNEVSRIDQNGERIRGAGMQKDFAKADDTLEGIEEDAFGTEK